MHKKSFATFRLCQNSDTHSTKGDCIQKYRSVESCMATIYGNDLQRERNGADLSSIICGLLGTIYVRGDDIRPQKCFKTGFVLFNKL